MKTIGIVTTTTYKPALSIRVAMKPATTPPTKYVTDAQMQFLVQICQNDCACLSDIPRATRPVLPRYCAIAIAQIPAARPENGCWTSCMGGPATNVSV